MSNWQIERIVLGIIAFSMIIRTLSYSKLCDRVTRLETLQKLLENEIKLIHKKEGENK